MFTIITVKKLVKKFFGFEKPTAILDESQAQPRIQRKYTPAEIEAMLKRVEQIKRAHHKKQVAGEMQRKRIKKWRTKNKLSSTSKKAQRS